MRRTEVRGRYIIVIGHKACAFGDTFGEMVWLHWIWYPVVYRVEMVARAIIAGMSILVERDIPRDCWQETLRGNVRELGHVSLCL